MGGRIAAADVARDMASDAVSTPFDPDEGHGEPLPDELTAYRVADRLFANTYLHCK
jgi:hypothetical protein